MFTEGERPSVMDAVDKAIAATRHRWVGRFACDVYRLNKDNKDAAELAVAYVKNQHLSEATIQHFLDGRPNLHMWATFYPPSRNPELNPYSLLHMWATVITGEIHSVIAPFEITPTTIDS